MKYMLMRHTPSPQGDVLFRSNDLQEVLLEAAKYSRDTDPPEVYEVVWGDGRVARVTAR